MWNGLVSWRDGTDGVALMVKIGTNLYPLMIRVVYAPNSLK